MTSVEQHLRRWLSAGVIDGPTAERLRAFERDQAKLEPDDERPGVLEAVVYLGVVVASVGAVVLVGQNWDELEGWARIATLVVPGVLAILAGFVLRATREAPLERAAQMAWLAALALLAGSIVVGGRELGGENVTDEETRNALMAAGLGAVALAVALWALAPTHLQVFGVAGSVFFLGQVTGNWPDEFDPKLAGAVLFLLGGVGLALAVADRLTPGVTARVLFGTLMAAGPYQAGLDGNVPWAEFAAFAAGAGLIALSVVRGYFALTVAGVGVIFVALVTYVFEHFEDDIGAPMALMVTGGVVVGGVLLLVQAREIVRQRRSHA